MSAISNVSMPALNTELLARISGPVTARNMAKAVYEEKVKKQEQASKPNQAAAIYRKGSYTDYAALLGSASRTSYTPETANEAAAKGTPTHGFFFHDIAALAETAADPEKKLDDSFARDTLDFFTGGNYKKADVEKPMAK